jgi:hypothetical protein
MKFLGIIFYFSISDDKIMYKWDLNNPTPLKLMELD